MSLSVFSDRYKRRSRTFRTKCRYCGADVYFYTDECGSKVFFDDLGPPWPKHECQEYLESIEYQPVVPRGPVGRFVHFEGELIHESEYFNRIAGRERKRKTWTPPIIAVHAEGSPPLLEAGILREVIIEVDPLKRFGTTAQNEIACAALRHITTKTWSQITIHIDDLGEDQIESYTMLLPRLLISSLRPHKGDLLLFAAEPLCPFGCTACWLCTELESV